MRALGSRTSWHHSILSSDTSLLRRITGTRLSSTERSAGSGTVFVRYPGHFGRIPWAYNFIALSNGCTLLYFVVMYMDMLPVVSEVPYTMPLVTHSPISSHKLNLSHQRTHTVQALLPMAKHVALPCATRVHLVPGLERPD